MRVPRLISECIEWRWAPCVGLTAGSLAFVALSLLLIPKQIESAPPLADSWQVNRAGVASQQRALFGASLVQGNESMAQPHSDSETAPGTIAPDPAQAVAVLGSRGFSPIADRGQAPTPEAEPAPTSEPGRVVLQQPEPGGPAREVTFP